MTKPADLPDDFDENPPLDEEFFARARPALENPQLARVLAAQSLNYREALKAVIDAHESGDEMDDAIAQARLALMAAE